ncbi:nuclear factor 7, ovary-like [Mantella aurantiaca]
MADASVEEDRTCYICQNPYTDPAPLECGHSFCRRCIAPELDTQEGRGNDCCPRCETETVFCTYCLHDSVPAVKTCLHCTASLCAKHLRRHSEEPEHVLVGPTASPEELKCSEHKQVLNYYCKVEKVFICLLCYKGGDHSNHEVLLLNTDSFENEKKNLSAFLEGLRMERQKIEAQIRSLQDQEAEQVEKTDSVSERVIAQIQNLQTELNALWDKVLNDVRTQRKNFLDWNIKLEERRRELSRKINNIEKLCNMTDPLPFLRKILGTDPIGIINVENSNVNSKMFDETPISETLQKELLKTADGLINLMLKDAFPKMKKSKITLDIMTAHYNIVIRNNLRSAYYRTRRQAKDCRPERFRSKHVLSKCSFSSGSHYWEVEVKGTQYSFGVAYDNIERKITRFDSRIGYNKRSWALSVDDNFNLRHNHVTTKIPITSPVRSFGIFLEYEAGRLSFYQLCKPIKYLYTFTTTFTRSLHAAFYIGEGSKIIILN